MQEEHRRLTLAIGLTLFAGGCGYIARGCSLARIASGSVAIVSHNAERDVRGAHSIGTAGIAIGGGIVGYAILKRKQDE